EMHERRRAEGVTDRASRGHRHYAARCGVSDAHPQGRGAGVASHRAHGRRRGRGRVVSPDGSHRAEDCARMAQITASVVVAVVAGAASLPGQTSLSIYSDGRVVVRRTLPQSLEKGKNTLTLKLDELDAATLFSPDSSVALLSAVLRPATDEASALRRAVGQTLAFVRARTSGGADTVRATVLRTDPAQFRLSDGRVLLSAPGEP